MKPYYDEDGITIYHGDCLEILPDLCLVDLVITSPPYNLGMHPSGNGSGMHAGSLAASDLTDGYDGYDDRMDQTRYDAWQTTVLGHLWDHLVLDGAIFYNHKARPMNGAVHLPFYGPAQHLRQIIVWDRGTGMNFSASHFLPKAEWILVWAKAEWRLKSKEASAVGDVWRFPPEVADDHPAPFPIGLPARVIEATAPRVVLDPFMGSGTTLRAAKDAGVPAIGIEISERYCEIAAKRLAQGVLNLA